MNNEDADKVNMEQPIPRLYQNIKNQRIKIKMSQDTLAEKTGYDSRTTISKIESGKIDIPQSKIIAFAEALNTTPSELMGWNEYETSEDSSDNMLVKEPSGSYYTNDETAKIAQEIYENPELKILFDTTKNVKPEDLKLITEMVKRMSGGND